LADPDAQRQPRAEAAELGCAQILADARIAQLEDVQLGQIDQQIDADAPALNDAIAGMQRALGDLQDAAKVLVAASALLKVVGRVLTSVAL
jgi:hypothetical protein